MAEQLHFNPSRGSQEFIRALREQYPDAPLARLVRGVFEVGQAKVQADPKELSEVITKQRNHPR